MTLHTNNLRYIADKNYDLVRHKDLLKEARTSLNDAANEIDKLRLEVSLLNVQLTYAAKVKTDVS